jgi:Ca2+-binding EF-hand superfamily protein
MKKSSTALIALAAAAAVGGGAVLATGTAWADKGGRCGEMGWHGGDHEGGFGVFDHGRHGAKMFKQFDENGDGSVTRAEVDAFLAGKITSFDGDSSGTLSIEEFQALWLEQVRPMMVRHFQFLDVDGNGQVTAEEMNEPAAMMMDRLDRDEDGTVTKDELRHRGKGRHHGDRHPMKHDDKKDWDDDKDDD